MQSRKEDYIMLVIVYQMKLWQNKQLKKVEGYPNTSRKGKKKKKLTWLKQVKSLLNKNKGFVIFNLGSLFIIYLVCIPVLVLGI